MSCDWCYGLTIQRIDDLVGTKAESDWSKNMEIARSMQHDLGPDLPVLSMKVTMDRLDGQTASGLLC